MFSLDSLLFVQYWITHTIRYRSTEQNFFPLNEPDIVPTQHTNAERNETQQSIECHCHRTRKAKKKQHRVACSTMATTRGKSGKKSHRNETRRDEKDVCISIQIEIFSAVLAAALLNVEMCNRFSIRCPLDDTLRYQVIIPSVQCKYTSEYKAKIAQ